VKESGGEGEMAKAGIVQVHASKRVEAFLIFTQQVQEAGQDALRAT
jgi:hypothetical protein